MVVNTWAAVHPRNKPYALRRLGPYRRVFLSHLEAADILISASALIGDLHFDSLDLHVALLLLNGINHDINWKMSHIVVF